MTFDSAHALPECLGALNTENVPVIVVDNASTDDTAAAAEGQGARVIRNARNQWRFRPHDDEADRMHAAERNHGLMIADIEYFFQLHLLPRAR